ncbi:hypothetical protein NECAME_05790 [Necator americanus]|uniref:Uncharacterized protein n=1 Tax=Necator americanus TaxID=51031 RepID=W2TZ45_NECAM|nr:hypothetical protein NECAME_05790 [Necator americanus]ETN86944.1 hypothetical protein NECAME_05790 [Necator americanus]
MNRSFILKKVTLPKINNIPIRLAPPKELRTKAFCEILLQTPANRCDFVSPKTKEATSSKNSEDACVT